MMLSEIEEWIVERGMSNRVLNASYSNIHNSNRLSEFALVFISAKRHREPSRASWKVHFREWGVRREARPTTRDPWPATRHPLLLSTISLYRRLLLHQIDNSIISFRSRTIFLCFTSRLTTYCSWQFYPSLNCYSLTVRINQPSHYLIKKLSF